MSYIRASYPLKYVKNDNGSDYVFHSVGDFIQDYGKISDDGIVELLFRNWKTKDDDELLFKEHILKRLADRLGVELRKKPLTPKQEDKIHEKRMKAWRKTDEYKSLMKAIEK